MPQKRQETEGMDKIIPLPDYKIEMPSKKLVKCLQLIDDHEDGKVSKKYKGGSLNCHSLASVAITPPPYIKSLFILQKLIANESHISI